MVHLAGLAIAERLAGTQGLLMIAVLIGVCVPLFNVAAVWPMARHGQHSFARELLRNPLIIATASGLAANLLGFQIPEWAVPTVSRISSASLALGLMAAGAGLQFGLLTRGKTLSISVLAIRHLVQPLVAFGMARMFGLDAVQTTVLLAFAALPTASTCYVLAALPRLRLRGLMCIPEATDDLPRLREQLAVLPQLRAQLAEQGLALDTLSMGMSADLELAVACGSTLVRVGTAIFGGRTPRHPA